MAPLLPAHYTHTIIAFIITYILITHGLTAGISMSLAASAITSAANLATGVLQRRGREEDENPPL